MVSENGTHRQVAYVYNPADSHLIAAAPELLEAARNLVEYMRLVADRIGGLDFELDCMVSKVEDAICKAEGGEE